MMSKLLAAVLLMGTCGVAPVAGWKASELLHPPPPAAVVPAVLARSAISTGYSLTASVPLRRVIAVQCLGITQQGRQCRRMTRDLSGRCPSHRR